jgi:hypothetical protein
MQITGLSAGYSDSGAVGRRNELLEAVTGKGREQNSQAAGGLNARMEELKGIVSQYDLTDMTPRDFSEMLRELRDAGALTESEYSELGQIRLDMDIENLDPDDSLNLLEFYGKSVDRARGGSESDMASTMLASMERCLNWLEKVAVLQESPDAAGLNALV